MDLFLPEYAPVDGGSFAADPSDEVFFNALDAPTEESTVANEQVPVMVRMVPPPAPPAGCEHIRFRVDGHAKGLVKDTPKFGVAVEGFLAAVELSACAELFIANGPEAGSYMYWTTFDPIHGEWSAWKLEDGVVPLDGK